MMSMSDFFAAFIGDPFDYPGRYLFAYLALPVAVTTALALCWRHASKTEIGAFSAVISAITFVLMYCVAHGVHSTIGLGFMIALFVHSVVSAATVIIIRTVQRSVRAT